jgi:hypothetical protein
LFDKLVTVREWDRRPNTVTLVTAARDAHHSDLVMASSVSLLEGKRKVFDVLLPRRGQGAKTYLMDRVGISAHNILRRDQ